jgi:uncharacterized phage protein (TIGR02220 family)
MARYRQIHCCIWNDDKFPFLSDDEQLVFFHLLTTPFGTPFGLYKTSIGALADEKRWDLKRYAKPFGKLLNMGFVKYDKRTLVLYIPRFMKYNPPANPNVVTSWLKQAQEIPDSPLKNEWYCALEWFAKGFGKPLPEGLANGMANGMAIQEQEQRTGTENKRKETLSSRLDGAAPDSPSIDKSDIPCTEIVSHLNQKAGKAFKAGNKITQKLIKARWEEGYRVEDFTRVIDLKCKEWLRDPKMAKYLRPSTLFGDKLEAYVNEATAAVVSKQEEQNDYFYQAY